MENKLKIKETNPLSPQEEPCICWDYACPKYHLHDTEVVIYWKECARLAATPKVVDPKEEQDGELKNDK